MGLKFREGERGLARVADLATVPAGVRVLGEVAGCEATDLHAVNFDDATSGFEAVLDHVHVELEDPDGFVFVEFGVVETDVDAGGEGFVEVADAVGGEEEDTGVVFHEAEEH